MKKRLKIAIVLNRFYPEVGGAETNLYFQATELAKHHDITIFTPLRMNLPRKEVINGFTVHRLQDWRNLKNQFPNIKTKTCIPSVFFRILFGQFDLVQVFPSMNHNTMLALIAAKLAGKPYILCSFDFLDYAKIISANNGSIDPNLLKTHTPKKRLQFFLRKPEHIFAISNREIELYKRYNKHVSFSPVPILPDEFVEARTSPRPAYGLSEDDFIFMCLGRVSRIKGQDLAVQAFARIKDKIPNAKLVFVGRCDYDPEIVKEMNTLAEKEGFADRFLMIGMIERCEVIEWLQHADIHIIPVRFMNSGAVVAESWAGGTPVIQSDAVDPNLVEEGINGYVFPNMDVDMLAEKMLKAYENRDKFPEMVAAGREKVYAGFTYEVLVQKYQKVYDCLCGNPQ
jgi:glycosyltransferase involved in cell wall biosynthesis